MKAKTFSDKWDREENLQSTSSVAMGRPGKRNYLKWIIIGIIILVVSIILQKLL